MDMQPIDFSPLDPTADAAVRERLVGAVMAHAESELARRAAARSPILMLARWARPALSAAAMLAAVSAGAIVLWENEPGQEAVATAESAAQVPGGITDALGVPAPVMAWVVADREPTVADVISALEGELP